MSMFRPAARAGAMHVCKALRQLAYSATLIFQHREKRQIGQEVPVISSLPLVLHAVLTHIYLCNVAWEQIAQEPLPEQKGQNRTALQL